MSILRKPGRLILVSVLGCLMAVSVYAGPTQPFVPGQKADGAPAELLQWGKMVGQWSTTEEQLKPDGSGWVPSKGADWDFFWSFGGWGIQDNYTSPANSEAVDDESKRNRGINLRIYNPVEKKWVLTWLTTHSKEPESFTAISDNDSIVMLADKKNSRGKFARITFYDITDQHFEWKLEWSDDKSKWLEVYRIHGTKK